MSVRTTALGIEAEAAICYCGTMANTTGMAKTAGRTASVLCGAGVIAFFIGIFGGPRVLAFTGVALMVASLVGFFIEEQSNRRALK